MKTRMDLWKDYRTEIESNIVLQRSVQRSNEKLNILYKRLIEALPEYAKKYKVELKASQAKIKPIGEKKSIPTESIEKQIEFINSVSEFERDSFKSIDELDFSSHELDDVLEKIKERKMMESERTVTHTTQIVLNKTKLVDLTREVTMSNKINVAIDGPSGSGKSTIAKLVAAKYGLTYINTGLVYRAIALNALEHGIDLTDPRKVMDSVKDGMIELLEDEVVVLNGENISKSLRSNEVSTSASKVAAIPEVREWAVKLQKSYAKKDGIIMDGRDTTFKIMPNADLKIFLDTSPEVRAQRRVNQNKELGFDADYNEILADIKERDQRDRNREVDPLHKTDDAILIDASTMTIDDVVEEITKQAEKIA